MKIQSNNRRKGYSILMAVVSAGLLIMVLLMMAYRQTIRSIDTQREIQMRVDYTQKENALLRAITTVLPQYAAKAMQKGSSANAGELDWGKVFQTAADYANAITAKDDKVASLMDSDAILANTGQVSFRDVRAMIRPVKSGQDGVLVSPGLGVWTMPYPDGLESPSASQEAQYPLVNSAKKNARGAAFELLKYPKINFGLVKQGNPFIAKRNWWAFTIDYTAVDGTTTQVVRTSKEYVISLYEVPSQTPISSAAVAVLGSYENGEKWGGNITVDGSVVGSAVVADGSVQVAGVAARGNVELAQGAKVGKYTATGQSVLDVGVREKYIAGVVRGEFLPAASSGDSGRVAFMPINPGAAFFQLDFDKLGDSQYPADLSQVPGAESWEKYSRGALQCPMRVLIHQLKEGTTTPIPATVEISYVAGGVRRREIYTSNAAGATIDGITAKAWPSAPEFPLQINAIGETSNMSSKQGLELRLSRIPAWLASKGATTAENFAVVVNSVPCSAVGTRPAIKNQLYAWTGDPRTGTPLVTAEMIRLVLNDCENLVGFDRGFAVVSDMMTHIMDNLNSTSKIPFALFAPAVRYRDHEEVRVEYQGQMSSIALDPTKAAGSQLRPVGFGYGDTATLGSTGTETGRNTQQLAAQQVKASLYQLTRVEELPPVTLKNWLVMVEQISR